jgi:hypothetical protein
MTQSDSIPMTCDYEPDYQQSNASLIFGIVWVCFFGFGLLMILLAVF